MSEKAKVLVVDDDPDIVEILRLVLQTEGYQVLTAHSAADAFAKLEATPPNLILLDVMMPEGTEGFQFVWRLRNEYAPELAQTPIIILSAIHETTKLRFYPEETDGTYKPGEYLPVQAWLDKPIQVAALLRTVEQALGYSRER